MIRLAFNLNSTFGLNSILARLASILIAFSLPPPQITQQDQKNKASQDTQESNAVSQNAMSEALIGDITNHRILSYQDKAPVPSEGYVNNLKVLYSSAKHSTKKTSRYLPKSPERILDAPDIINDYYLQLLDWNDNNVLSVALNREVYLWNGNTGDITNLFELPEGEYISSVAWVEQSNSLAVGLSNSEIHIWDTERFKRLRVMRGHTTRVSSLSWNSYVLSSGCRSGSIFHHDVRIAQHQIGQAQGHCQEVCGLKWSPDKTYLASGGNDNVVNVWSNQFSMDSELVKPVYRFTDHQAAVKAIDWCPWKSNLLATGGGSSDRCIKIWNVCNGRNLYSIDTKSQVSSLLWSKDYKELISSHGYSNNELIVWKYPALTKVGELRGHTARILGTSMSPDGSTVVSLGADETLRFWNCFQVDTESKKKEEAKASKNKMVNYSLRHGIR